MTVFLLQRRTEKEKTDLMTFREIRERLMNRDAIREIQEIEERAEAEREREEERLRLRLAEKEQRALLLQSQQLGQQPEKASSSQQPQLSPQMLQQQQQQPLLLLEPGDKDGQPHHGQLVVVRSAGSGSKPLSAAADTSSEAVRKMKERFKKNVSQVIVTVLDPYRKSNATVARIQSTEDFKHLARKVGWRIIPIKNMDTSNGRGRINISICVCVHLFILSFSVPAADQLCPGQRTQALPPDRRPPRLGQRQEKDGRVCQEVHGQVRRHLQAVPLHRLMLQPIYYLHYIYIEIKTLGEVEHTQSSAAKIHS